MASRFRPLFNRLFGTRQRIIITATASTVVGVPLARYAVLDYRDYLKIGAGGVPYNAFGWLLQLSMRPFKKEPFGTGCYDEPKAIVQAGPNGNAAFLSDRDIPERNPPRPEVGSWTVPSRQTTDFSPEDIKDRYQKFLESVASSSPSQLKIAKSIAERRGPALFLTPENPPHPIAKKTQGEIAHMHGIDGSLHVNLTPKDAKLVIERGWGQRHPMSGRILYLGLVMIYAPRSDEELQVVEKITRASVRFMLGEEA